MFVPINTQRGENRRAKQTNKENRMNTAELDIIEEQAFTAKRAAWSDVVSANTAEELDRATYAYRLAEVAYSVASRARYNAQPAQPGRQVF